MLLERGFRIFFLAGALWAILGAPLWMMQYAGLFPFVTQLNPHVWHGHAMLSGYAGAIVAGFLLTAPGNWTGQRLLHGLPLAVLFSFWLAGRVLPLPPFVPAFAAFLADSIFFGFLALYLGRLLYRFRHYQNLSFAFFLGLLALAQWVVYAGWQMPRGNSAGNAILLYSILFIVFLLGGRVIPNFTKARFPEARVRIAGSVETAVYATTAVAMLTSFLAIPDGIHVFLWSLAAIAHAFRWFGYFTWEVFKEPFLWILHLGYAWVVIGFLLQAISYGGVELFHLARHALTVGGIGCITLGMMVRVTQGHTGLRVQATWPAPTVFGLICVSALFRVVFPLLMPDPYVWALWLAVCTWSAAFLIFILIYGPLLFRSR